MLRKIKRILALLAVPPLLLLIYAVVFQGGIYRNNLAVSIAKLPAVAPLQKTDRLLVIAPHLDDETLGAAGAIATARQNGIATRIVFITNGDGSGSTRLVAQVRELRSNIAPDEPNAQNLFQRIAAMRRKEALAACKQMGVDEKNVFFLGYPDGGTRFMLETNWDAAHPYLSPYTQASQSPYSNSFTPNAPYAGSQVAADLEKIITDFRPTVLMTTHPEDMHPDHASAYAYTFAALERLRLSGNKALSGYLQKAKLQTFLVHHGFWPTPHGYRPDANLAPPATLEHSDTDWLIQMLSPKSQEAKRAALDEYSSQLVFTPNYLRAFVRRNELFGKVPVRLAARNQQSTTLLNNPAADSLWREAWKPGDIEKLTYARQGGQLTLGMALAAAPSAQGQYRFVLHAVTSRGVKAWTVITKISGDSLQATLNSDNTSPLELTGTPTAQGMDINIPIKDMGISQETATVLISASSYIGMVRLGQTATVALRLQ